MKPINCRNLSSDQKYIKEVLTKNFYVERKTVAPESNNGMGLYDFDSIEEAFIWVKMIGAELNAPNGIELVLGKGSHYLRDNEVLGSGVHVDEWTENPLLYLRDIELHLTGEGTGASKLLFENENTSGIVFHNVRMTISALSIGISAHLSPDHQIINFIGSQINIHNAGFTDVELKTSYGTVLRMSSMGGTSGFCSTHTENEEVVSASMSSFVYMSGVDFNGRQKRINATENSYIYLKHNIDEENIITNIERNKLSQDMSLIYDHEAVGVYTTNLKYIDRNDHVEIFNSAGDGFEIPTATDTSIGLMTPEEKLKLEQLRPQAEDQCLNKFAMWNEDTEVQDQTTYIVRDVSSNYVKIYSNGTLVRDNEYDVTFNYDNILIVFHDPKNRGDWIAVEYAL